MGILKDRVGLYYEAGGDHGSYRKLRLLEVIDSFNDTYVGEGKICEGVLINDITFHAIRAMQELSYDTLRSEKDMEIIVPSTLTLVLPVDYVNYVKLAWSDSKGIERIIYPTTKSSITRDITEVNTVTGLEGEAEIWGGFDTAGDDVDLSDDEVSQTLENFRNIETSDVGSVDADEIDDQYGDLHGQRYGLDPASAQVNGSFFIDEEQGKIHFSSALAGKTLVFKYISDGLIQSPLSPGSNIDLSATVVHKFAEEAIYKHILYGVLLARKDTPAGLLAQIKKARFAATRNAKSRLSNYKSEEMAQVMRGSSKIIKH